MSRNTGKTTASYVTAKLVCDSDKIWTNDLRNRKLYWSGKETDDWEQLWKTYNVYTGDNK